MSVYAKKNSSGDLTGAWVVDVTRRGVRLPKKTFRDLREAKAHEKALMDEAAAPVAPVAVPVAPEPLAADARVYTVGDLKQDVRHIWRNDKSRRQTLQRFDDSMDILGLGTPLADVLTLELDRLVLTLRNKGLADPTIRRYLSPLSKALRWAAVRRHIKTKPEFPWEGLGKGEARETTISEEEDDRIMAWTREHDKADIVVCIDLMMSTGMRVGEVVKLEPDDFDRRDSTVTIGNWEGRTKNGTRRVNYLQPDLHEKCIALATAGWPSYRRINLALHRVRKAVGIKAVITPHTCRHTAITRMHRAGVPLFTIMRVVGHKSSKTTERYVHTKINDITTAALALTRGGARGEMGGE
jgi:integrase